MRVHYSSPLAAIAVSRSNRDTFVPLLRWLIFGAALMLSLLALSRAGVVGAQAPADCIPINQTSCFSNGIIYTNGTPTANIGVPNPNPVPAYAVPGISYPYYGYSSYVASNYRYIGYGGYGGYGGYIAPYYRSPYYGGYVNNYIENYGYLGTDCDPKAWWCLNDELTGNVFANLFGPSTSPTTPSALVTAPSGTGAVYRTAEVAQPAAPVTAPIAAPQPAAPVTAPVVAAPQPTAPVVEPVAAPQAAPTTQMATALNTPTQIQAPTAQPDATVTILSVQATAPAASVNNNNGRDDGK